MKTVCYEIIYRATPDGEDKVYCTYDDPVLARKRLADLLETPQNVGVARLVKIVRIELPMTEETYLAAINALSYGI